MQRSLQQVQLQTLNNANNVSIFDSIERQAYLPRTIDFNSAPTYRRIPAGFVNTTGDIFIIDAGGSMSNNLTVSS